MRLRGTHDELGQAHRALASARKHGVSDDDILHAYQHPIRVLQLEDLTMPIGPDLSARLLEIGVPTTNAIARRGAER